MNITEVKTNIHQLVERVQDDDFLVKVESILESYISDKPVAWNDLPVELRIRLENAENDSLARRTTSHEEVVMRFRKQYAHFYES